MIPIRKLAFILGLLVIAPRAEAAVLEFDLSAVSVASGPSGVQAGPFGYTATVSFTLDSSAFTSGQVFNNSNGSADYVVNASVLTSFSAHLTTPLGDRYFGLSDVHTNTGPCRDFEPCWTMDFYQATPTSPIIFSFAQDGFTQSILVRRVPEY
jgi:hypothetical protein